MFCCVFLVAEFTLPAMVALACSVNTVTIFTAHTVAKVGTGPTVAVTVLSGTLFMFACRTLVFGLNRDVECASLVTIGTTGLRAVTVVTKFTNTVNWAST